MGVSTISRKERRSGRHRRIRRKVSGTADRPRLAIMISSRHMYAQFIDDERGVTLASASTIGDDGKHNVATATALGSKVGGIALAAGIRQAVVDRGGFKFHGRIKAIVDAAKAAGLAFEFKEAS